MTKEDIVNMILAEEGVKVGLKIGRKHEERFFSYYQKYRCRRSKNVIKRRIKSITKKIKEGKDISELMSSHQLEFDRAKRRLEKNEGFSAVTRKKLERIVIVEQMFLELLEALMKKDNINDFDEYMDNIVSGLKVGVGI